MAFQNVVLAGGGVLGSQIAYQSAFKGFHVTIWLRSEGSIGRTQPKLDQLHERYLADIEGLRKVKGTNTPYFPHGLVDRVDNLTDADIDALKERADKAYRELTLTLDMGEAMADADLVIEAMAENPQAKIDFYTKLRPFLPEKTILVTNSSTLLPSTFAEVTGRPAKFLALHFANNIWRSNTAEVMGHAGTDPAAYQQVVDFAQQIGMVPLQLKKEQPGYILNTMLVPFLNAGQALLALDVADPETIDLTWRLGTGAPMGPFQILDIVGLDTAYNIVCNHPDAQDPASLHGKIAAILKEKIDAGKKGVAWGEGFYKYK